MTFEKLSPKQKEVFRFPYREKYRAIICDGAVRSGKTICMITSFILWAMRRFNGATFGICGKTVASAERNIVRPLQTIRDITHYFKVTYSRSNHLLTVENKHRRNYFFVYGGKDESSYTLLQGITLSGIFLDEVALMPESFVNQAIARTLSVSDRLYWFNCNPESPAHWFYNEWILKAEEKNALHLHFLMSDNPTMTPGMLAEAEQQFSGIFYNRYILGLWTIAEGLIYSEFGEANITDERPEGAFYYISIDYGTQNPFSAGLWSVTGRKAVRIKEYYYSGRAENIQKTDEEYCDEIDRLAEGYRIKQVIVDPSAASFIEALRRHGYIVIKAKNDVMDGIRNVSSALKNGRIMIHRSCTDSIREFGLYQWNKKAGSDAPVKENDHAMDDIRYFVNTVLYNQGGYFAEVIL